MIEREREGGGSEGEGEGERERECVRGMEGEREGDVSPLGRGKNYHTENEGFLSIKQSVLFEV